MKRNYLLRKKTCKPRNILVPLPVVNVVLKSLHNCQNLSHLFPRKITKIGHLGAHYDPIAQGNCSIAPSP